MLVFIWTFNIQLKNPQHPLVSNRWKEGHDQHITIFWMKLDVYEGSEDGVSLTGLMLVSYQILTVAELLIALR